MHPIRHYEMPTVDDSDDGLDADEALLLGRPTGHLKPRPSRSRLLAGGIVLALSLVAGAWILVTLAEAGWRLVL